MSEKKLSFTTDTDLVMRRLGDIVSQVVGPEYGFMIMVFPFGKPGVSNYVSNAKREEMIKGLREKADVLEAGGDIMVEPNAPKN